MPRCLLSYEEFLTDWRRQVERIAAQTGLGWPDHSDRSDIKIDNFLTADLRRERFSVDAIMDHPAVVPLARDVYGTLTAIVTQGETKQLLDRLDQLRAKFNEACRTFAPAFADVAAAQRDLESERDSVRAERDRLVAARDTLLANREGASE